MGRSLLSAAAIAVLMGAGPAPAQPQWPEDFLSRVEILALVQTLKASLLSASSATATLEKWCADHKMAPQPKITARRIADVDRPASEDTRQRLRLAPGEPVKYRRVELVCGAHVLSEAENWYVPGRLSDDMNRALETTETPFGKAVAPLEPYRRTVETTTRWSPLPEGWELAAQPKPAGTTRALAIPHELFEHKAVLFTAEQTPISEVHERYTSEILDFPAAPAVKSVQEPPALR